MAKMKKDEATLLKSLMVELDDNTVLLVTHQYHTEPRESDGKPDREKSRYIWISRVMTKDEVNAWAKWCWADENRLGRWKWPGTENTWPFYLLVNKDGDCRAVPAPKYPRKFVRGFRVVNVRDRIRENRNLE